MEPGGHAPPNRVRARGGEGEGSRGLSPIYQRLPRGPHSMGRAEVREHQRMRIHGAMVEAIARSGYEQASVKQVISLAGVSRRSFYEQFQNKQDCFGATFEVVAERQLELLRLSYRAGTGGIDERLHRVFETCAEIARRERSAALLVLVDAQTAGVEGVRRLRRASATCERMLGLSFERSSRTAALPAPIVRAITGGLHGALVAHLREPSADGAGLADELLAWTLACHGPGTRALMPLLQQRVRLRMRELSVAQRDAARPAAVGGERDRLLHTALRLAVTQRYAELTAPQIADEAGLSIETFFDHFAGRDQCFLAALEMAGDELAATATCPPGEDWAQSARAAIERLLCNLAGRPVHARAIIQGVAGAGREPFEWSLALASSLADALLLGAPTAPSDTGRDAVAGALWHTIRCQVSGGRIALLAALPDYLSYLVLSSVIGAPAAAEALTTSPTSR